MSSTVKEVVRPDGRLLVRCPSGWTAGAAAAAAELAGRRARATLAHVDESAVAERAALLAAGFVEARREAVVVISVEPALAALESARLPAEIEVRSAADVDVDRLRLLDDELRQDVPGTSGWRSTPDEFAENTFADPAFDPATYLVAVERATGELVGLARIWMNTDGPRLGMAGVRRSWRRRAVASALLAGALEALRASGARELTTDYDVTNAPAAALAARLGARRTGVRVELLNEPAPVEEASHVA